MRKNQRFNQTLPQSAASKKTAPRKTSDNGVLLSATELFVTRSRHHIEETRIFLELARNLLSSTSVGDRRRIASLLAPHPEMPDDLLERLARDDDELTAYPALRYSPRLSVDLLLETAMSGPDSLRKAVANRPSLRESVIGALCKYAGASVVRILLDRHDVILNPNHQTNLSRRSDIVATLGLELAGQDALNPDGLMGQFLHLPTSLKSKAIAAAEMTSLVKQAQAPGNSAGSRSGSARLQLCDALVKEAIQQNKPRFSDLLSRDLSLPSATCDLLLQDDQCEGLTVALKALGMQPSQLMTVLIRLFGETTSLEKVRDLLRLHRTLSPGAAEVLVSQWILHEQSAPNITSQYAAHYQDSAQRVPGTDNKSRAPAADMEQKAAR